MSRRRIHVRISPQGSIGIDAGGFRGKGCEAATRALEEALGKLSSRTLKPSYHQAAANPDIQKLGGGS